MITAPDQISRRHLPASRPLALALTLVLGAALAAPGRAGPPPSSVHAHHTVTIAPPPSPTFNQGGTTLWPKPFTRVAVLPLHDSGGALTVEVRRQYDRIWLSELQRTERAEFVTISSAAMTRWTGAGSIDSTAALPAELLQRITRDTGAQAVMLLDLVHLSPHQAGSLGVRVKLVDLNQHQIVWMADESFNLRDSLSSRALNRFIKAHRGIAQVGDPRVALRQSPSLFATLVFESTLRYLPPRPRGRK
jgi:hypothetical protein